MDTQELWLLIDDKFKGVDGSLKLWKEATKLKLISLILLIEM